LKAKALKEEVSRQLRQKQDEKVEKYVDVVEFGKQGYRERYYSTKFFIKNNAQMDEMQKNIRQAYIEGLSWVFQYYYKGCVSWEWFYPYHYAPMAYDLINCD
jgi:5'-3' exoribonuclease 2